MIEFGASPRASIWLMRTAKANALLNGRGFIIPEDVRQWLMKFYVIELS